MGPCGGGFGWGGGYGRSFGRRCGVFGWRMFASPKNELQDLENEEKILEEELTAIREQKAALAQEQKQKKAGDPASILGPGSLLSSINLA
jgi:hypothetical protein